MTTSPARVAVAGGTGVLGRHVVAALAAAGAQPVVLSRSAGTDLTATGPAAAAALRRALDGCASVVDVTSITGVRAATFVDFADRVVPALQAAAADAGVQHLLAVSVVGSDVVPVGYYRGKQHQEQLVRAGDVPWTVVRATQFHEFAGQVLDRTSGPLAPVPSLRCRPVAAADVAAYVAELALGAPRGMAEPIAGPQEHDLVDLARRTLRHRGSTRRVVPLPLPGRAGRLVRQGALIPPAGAAARTGPTTFDAWLALDDVPVAG